MGDQDVIKLSQDIGIVQAKVESIEANLCQVKNDIREMRKENAEAIQRMHEENMNLIHEFYQKIDEVIKKDTVSRSECEEKMIRCKNEEKQEHEKLKGYPPWIIVIFSVLSAAIVELIHRF